MAHATYAVTELVGTSPDSIEDAIQNGIATASSSVRNMNWFEVTEIRGYLGKTADVDHYQVTMKIGFRYEDDG